MKSFSVVPACGAQGSIKLSGDKSIAHRALILSALSQQKTAIYNYPSSDDCLATLNAFKALGCRISQKKEKGKSSALTVTVKGQGLSGLRRPARPIFVGESGTTMRLLLGVLAGCSFQTTVTGASSLVRRPMARVCIPLRLMGARIEARGTQDLGSNEEYPPLNITGGELQPLTYTIPVASAQVKSAILLAALFADGVTRVIEPIATRDHTERMLAAFGARIKVNKQKISLIGNTALTSPRSVYVPADISSAAFFIVLGAIMPNSLVTIEGVGLNPTRMGIVQVLRRMGADIKVKNQKLKVKNAEPIGDIIVATSKLKATVIKREEIPLLIDEIPILMVAASFARGRTVFQDAQELRVKETDRIVSMVRNLRALGVRAEINKTAQGENVAVYGAGSVCAGRVESFGDHRTAMSMIVAGLCAQGKVQIDDISCLNKSFPDFLSVLKPLLAKRVS